MTRLLRVGADVVAEMQGGLHSDRTEWLAEFRRRADAALQSRGLPTSNWWRGGVDNGIRYGAWGRFVEEVPALRCELEELIYDGVQLTIPPSGEFLERAGTCSVAMRPS